jgi:aspartyl protease family protein
VQGRTVRRVPVTAGPLAVSAVSVGVGLRGGKSHQALLGQNFLVKFNVSISESEMVIQRRDGAGD